MSFDFEKDGTFSTDTKRNGETLMQADGHWTFTSSRVIGLTIDHITVGKPSVEGTNMALGRVKLIDDQQMVLGTDNGDETYTRQ